MSLVDIKRENLRRYAKEKYGIECNRRGYAHCPFHPDDKNPSFQLHLYKGVWRWTDWHLKSGDSNFSGTIIDLKAKLENISVTEAINKLKEEFCAQRIEEFKSKRQAKRKPEGGTGWERTEYFYKDAKGNDVYKKVKLKNSQEEKRFWIEKKTENGWEKRKGEFNPIPYNLHEFKNHEKVLVVEGEKDANNVNSLKANIFATSPPTGKDKWDDRLIPFFRHFKETTFMYDVGAEEDAREHAAKLQNAYPDMDIYIAKVPLKEEKKDITDYLGQAENPIEALQSVLSNGEKLEARQRIIEIPTRGIQPIPDLEIDNSFLNRLVESLSQVTDAPKIFLIFSGVALLSGLLNKFYFEYPRRTHLNIYILLLARSTYYRKSTCINLVSDYLKECNPDLILPESFTAEALYDILAKYPTGLILWPELIQVKEFLMAKEYNKGLPAFLTDIYDYKEKMKRWTVGKGEIIVEKPVISILAAGITSWLIKNLRELDFEGGIWTRFLFVPASEMERRFTLPKSFTLDSEITRRLCILNDTEGSKVDLSRIFPLMQEWGTRHQDETMRLGTGVMSAMFQRLEVMLLKLAAIFQIAHDQTTVITPETFKEAVKAIEYIKTQLPTFFREEIHFGEHDRAMATILKFIKKKGRAMKKEILQGTKVPKRLADPALQQLEEEEEIKPVEIPAPPRGGRAGRAYEYIGGE